MKIMKYCVISSISLLQIYLASYLRVRSYWYQVYIKSVTAIENIVDSVDISGLPSVIELHWIFC